MRSVQLRENSRTYEKFSNLVLRVVLENNNHEQQKSERNIVSLLYSCEFYITLLSLTSYEQKAKLLASNPANSMGADHMLLFMFIELMNDQIPDNETEFLIYCY